jgi:hypothetical protein
LKLEENIAGDPQVPDLSDEARIEFEVPESSARTERLESGNLHHCIDLSWVCGCLDVRQNQRLDYARDPVSLIVTRHENSRCFFRLSLEFLPKVLPYEVQRCSYSILETRPAKGGLIRLGFGALDSDTTPPPRVVTILGNQRGRFRIRETLGGLEESQETDLAISVT